MERHRRVENDSTGTGGVPDGVRDQCVICYTRPEADCRRRRRRVKFLQIHARADENSKLYEFIAELLGFEIDAEPKVVCEFCYKKIMFIVKTFKRMNRLLSNNTPETLDSSSESGQNEQAD